MVLTMLLTFIPVNSLAAYSPSSVATETKTADEIAAIVQASQGYKFSSASEALAFELESGYLDSVTSKGGAYTLFVNRYTGAIYYKNNKTGELLTSNPYSLAGVNGDDNIARLSSQIAIQYTEITSGKAFNLYSSKDAAARAQVKLSYIDGGIRVSYTLGDTSRRVLLPAILTAKAFEESVLRPTIEYFEGLVFEHFPEEFWDTVADYNKFAPLFSSDVVVNASGQESPVYLREGVLNKMAFIEYFKNAAALFGRLKRSVDSEHKAYCDNLVSLANNLNSVFLDRYTCYDPETTTDDTLLGTMHAGIPETQDGQAFFVFGTLGTKPNAKQFKEAAKYLIMCNPEYSFEDMYEQEAASSKAPYTLETINAVFRCTLEYTFNEDGSLSVRLPANSISFDETVYNLDSISPLQFFGSGNLSEYGYAFVPDGSGSIIEFDEFYTPGVNREQITVRLYLTTYGLDYCYSYLDNMATRPYEQVTMPVYGVVSTQKAPTAISAVTGRDTMQTGFFAVLEEGSALATIYADFGGSIYCYGTAYASFNPYPSDTFTYDDGNEFDIVSKSKYTGSYVTRYVMLSDPDYTATVEEGYEATYIGMASYYREYLKETGVLESIRNLNDQLPLYIEALGSMEKVEQIATFPVTVEVPLTTFDNVIDMYNELSDVKNALIKKAQEHEEKVILPGDANDIEAKKYYALAEKVVSMNNVNFKLTGFANNGMYYTYPVKLDWESACGGRDGFINLLNVARETSKDGKNFGVFPEFDFMYINNTALFDGIDNKDNVSKMVDDRYGSKKVYNPVSSEFETVYAMIISPDVLDKHYSTFLGKYSEYNVSGISVSTLGSDLNSNFDRDNSINRDEARVYVEELLGRIVDDYDVMLSVGNIYTLAYADHVMDICIDSTHFNVSSYVVPFTGLVLHSYVSYTGSAMNYSGSPDYDLLLSIENGASLYYILCYQNEELMKDDEKLNKYYGVKYERWLESIAQSYTKLNWAIGDLQGYEIVDHKLLIAERDIEDRERVDNTKALLSEFVEIVRVQIQAQINAAYEEMFENPADIGRLIKLTVDVDALVAQAIAEINVPEIVYAEDCEPDLLDEFDKELREFWQTFLAELDAAVAVFTDYYTGVGEDNPYVIDFEAVDYASSYRYVTDSKATDRNYETTVYTVDNNKVTMITYRDSATGDAVSFVLNYNIYSVNVSLEGFETFTLSQYGFVRIDKEGIHFYG